MAIMAFTVKKGVRKIENGKKKIKNNTKAKTKTNSD